MERSGESRELWVAVHLIGSASQSDPQMQPRYVDSDAPSHATALLAVAVVKGTAEAEGSLAPLDAALNGAVARALASGDILSPKRTSMMSRSSYTASKVGRTVCSCSGSAPRMS